MKRIFILLPVLAILVTCKKDEDILLPDVIQPLGVGYRWTFIDSVFSEDGEIIGDDTSELKITGSEIADYNGTKVELFYWHWEQTDPELMWLASSESGGLYFYGVRNEGVNYIITKSVHQPYPVDVGDSWFEEAITFSYNVDSTINVFVSDTLELTCISTDFLFTTGIGVLECVVTSYYNDGYYIEIYFAPNIGYVGYKRFLDGEVVFKKTLLSYALSNGYMRNSEDDELYHSERSRADVWGSIFEE